MPFKSLRRYLSIVRGKTAALFGWALAAGGRANMCDGPTVASLGAIGIHLGTTFQLIDDLLYLQGDAAMTSKQGRADLRQGKLTWPMLVACERDAQLHAELVALAASPDLSTIADGGHSPSRQDIAWLARLRRTDALAQTQAFAQVEADLAIQLIGQLSPCPARAAAVARCSTKSPTVTIC